MTKLDRYYREPLDSPGFHHEEQLTYEQFVAARDERVAGHDWNFTTATHEYWVEGS